MAIFHGLAGLYDAWGTYHNQPHSQVLLEFAFVFLPLAIYSCFLAWLFWNWSDRLLSPRPLILLASSSALLGLPLYTLNYSLVTLLFEHRPLNQFFDEWQHTSSYNLWVDLCLILLAFSSQAGFASWRRSDAKANESALAQSANLELRLHLLYGQLKPHFLFNALNSIGALVRQADRRLAGLALQQLHGLLQYVIYSSRHEWLSVADELQFVRDYLDMQSLRFGERMQIRWNIQDCNWREFDCPPLLFQPLVENAIHHGVENHYDACEIHISLQLIAHRVHFSIRNPRISNTKKQSGHGLGIRYTQERLDLIYHHDAALDIVKTKEEFCAGIKFPIHPDHTIHPYRTPER